MAEVAQAILKYVRAGKVTLPDAGGLLADAIGADVELRPFESLVTLALDAAMRLRLSVYDACYVVLSQELELPLITADRRLAATAENAVLID
jgi:predicted nucleic acid-binding protein